MFKMGTPIETSIRYMFTIEATAEAQDVGDTPKGKRVDLEYKEGEVHTDATKYYEDWWQKTEVAVREKVESLWKDLSIKPPVKDSAEDIGRAMADLRNHVDKGDIPHRLQDGTDLPPLPWFGLDAKVLSGSDWATFRPDGVAEFSGRLTLKSETGDDAPIDAVFSGVVDLAPPQFLDPGQNRADEVKKAAAQSNGSIQDHIPVLLAVTFDVGRAAQTWAPKRYLRQGKGLWKYQRLTQGQFLAVGSVKVVNQHSRIQSLKICVEVLEVRPNPKCPSVPRPSDEQASRQPEHQV
jgi:hypothetical protein